MKRLHASLGGFLLVAAAATYLTGCGDSTSTSTASGSSGQVPENTAKLAINEIRAVTEDWLEILNVDDVEANLSGMALADQDTNGTPKLAEAVRFVDGEKLAPGAYLLVVANLKDVTPGPQTTCLMMGGPSRCYHATWGVSSSNGEQVFLLSPKDLVLDTVLYPVNAVMDGQSYCRLPNGDGMFAACAPTPGAANAAP